MLIALGLFVLLLIIFVPQIWTRAIFKQYSAELDGLPGSGGELAQHLVEKFQLKDVIVEEVEAVGDHYAPADKAVRLSPEVHN